MRRRGPWSSTRFRRICRCWRRSSARSTCRRDSKIVKVVKLIYADAPQLSEHLQGVFASDQKQAGLEAAVTRALPATSQPVVVVPNTLLSAEQNVVIYPVARTNHLILRGYPADLKRIEELIAQLDAPEDLQTRNYQIVHLAAEDVLASLESALGVGPVRTAGGTNRSSSGQRRTANRSSRQDGNRGSSDESNERIRLSCLEESNAIVVTAPAVVHRQVAELLKMCDIPPMEIAGGIRHYRLQNAAAADVAKILLELINQGEQQADKSQFKLGTGSTGPQITGPSAAVPQSPSRGSNAPGGVPAAPRVDRADTPAEPVREG